MEKFNINKDYMDLSDREIKLVMETLFHLRKTYDKFFSKQFEKIRNSKNEFETEQATEEIYSFYLEEIEEYFKLGYTLGKEI